MISIHEPFAQLVSRYCPNISKRKCSESCLIQGRYLNDQCFKYKSQIIYLLKFGTLYGNLLAIRSYDIPI